MKSKYEIKNLAKVVIIQLLALLIGVTITTYLYNNDINPDRGSTEIY